ncbi:OLC1v1024153C1 [Oldenlandia corymbosa var. corymbosa]|uniref:OLC1v1024153C1 n=1 Tax=Oldenlandia corymbosa var. corymbosa TaxID=529605 RepID=A0AAV1C433_OLDCO|nr:OLC1v1024153C1 [Oldenlandia corymbosa var. corymbosa]
MGLLETKLHGEKVMELMEKRWYNYCHISNHDNQNKGRILLLWKKDEYVVKEIKVDAQFIHCHITELECKKQFYFTLVYADYLALGRSGLWDSLKVLSQGINEAWLMIGNFNCVMQQSERLGGREEMNSDSRKFKQLIEECELWEMVVQGGFYTWSNKQFGNMRILSKLDRSFINECWENAFPEAYTTILNAGISDHHPLLVKWGEEYVGRKTSFRFFNMWLQDQEYDLIILRGADIHTVTKVKKTMEEFEATTGLRINFNKSNVYVAGVSNTIADQIQSVLGFEKGNFPMKYLGMPISPTAWKPESAQHLFFQCVFAKRLLELVKIWLDINIIPSQLSVQEVLQLWRVFSHHNLGWWSLLQSRQSIGSFTTAKKSIIMVTPLFLLWEVWKFRNKMIFEGTSFFSDVLITNIATNIFHMLSVHKIQAKALAKRQEVENLFKVQVLKPPRKKIKTVKWKPPDPGDFVMNTNESALGQPGEAGWAYVLRGEQGSLIKSVTEKTMPLDEFIKEDYINLTSSYASGGGHRSKLKNKTTVKKKKQIFRSISTGPTEIPHELIIEVLGRLPAQSLLRFRFDIGFDPISCDYKVLSTYFGSDGLEGAIYTIGLDSSWRKTMDPPQSDGFSLDARCPCVNGTIYSLVDSEVWEDAQYLFCFQVGTEVFYTRKFTQSLGSSRTVAAELAVGGSDKEWLICMSKRHDEDQIQIWYLEECVEGTNQVLVKDKIFLGPTPSLRSISGALPTGQVLLMDYLHSKKVYVDLKTKKFEERMYQSSLPWNEEDEHFPKLPRRINSVNIELIRANWDQCP